MEYSKLIAITGLGGLFELISSKSDGAIVRSLDDKSTKFVSNRLHSFSHVESIEVYTQTDNVGLADVFLAMQASKEALPDAKNDKAVRAYFEKVYPAMDMERVYNSDMKKMVRWYDIILKNNIAITKPAEGSEDAVAEKPVEKAEKKIKAPTAEKPAAAVKSAPAKKINTPRKMA
jgi:hypothetical protein